MNKGILFYLLAVLGLSLFITGNSQGTAIAAFSTEPTCSIESAHLLIPSKPELGSSVPVYLFTNTIAKKQNLPIAGTATALLIEANTRPFLKADSVTTYSLSYLLHHYPSHHFW